MAIPKSPNLKPIERLALAAKEYGVPKDQLENFLKAGYVPQPKQLEFHAACRLCDDRDGPDQIGFGGARGPGKSHAVFAQIALDDCQRLPGLKALYLRKVAKNAREQFEDLRRAVLRYTPHDYNRSSGMISFPNESRILIGHFKNEGDVDQYLGIEYDVIVIEEATTLTNTKYKTLRDSNRTSKQWRPRIYASTNPGGVGHAWFKERFITPARRHNETTTRFVFATIDDNKFVDDGYAAKLEENTGWKLKAYRYGDWDIAAGQYFTNWNYEAHVCKPFAIPNHWPLWASMDYGFNHPTVVYWFTCNDGIIYVIAEHWERKRLPTWHAEQINARTKSYKRWRPEPFVAGPDAFDTKGDKEGKTIAQQYAELGVRLTEANDARISGWGEILKLLGDPYGEKPIAPKVKVFDTCVKLIECIPVLQHNPNRPEDVLKVDIDEDGIGGDDAGDCFRYGIMARKAPVSSAPAVGGKRSA